MDLPRNVIQGNSRTMQRAVATGIAGMGTAGSLSFGGFDPTSATAGGATAAALFAALTSGGKRVDARVAQRVAHLLVSRRPATPSGGRPHRCTQQSAPGKSA